MRIDVAFDAVAALADGPEAIAIAEVVEDRVAPFLFPNPEKPVAPPLAKWDKVSVGYAADRPVLRNITLRLDPDDPTPLARSGCGGLRLT